MNKIALLALLILTSYGSFSQFTDKEGAEYPTVSLANIEWMAENLNTRLFLNGDSIPLAHTMKEWVTAGKEKRPICAYFNYKNSAAAGFGLAYNWFAITDFRGLIPIGWRLPWPTEYQLLTSLYSGKEKAGLSLLHPDELKAATSTVNSGFNARLAGGGIGCYSGLWGMNNSVLYWTNYYDSFFEKISNYHIYSNGYIGEMRSDPADGLYVRLIRVK